MNILAVDVGGSKIIVGIVNCDGTVLAEKKTVLPEKYGIDEVIASVLQSAEGMREYAPECIGVAIPGLADPETGTWKYAPFSGISNVPICKILSEKLGLPAFGDNDVNVCAVGERVFGICKDKRDYLWVTVSNGIGGGLVLDGEVYRGQGFSAGEIGHFIVEENGGRQCGCGNFGCLEAMASGTGIAARYRAATGKNLNAKEIASLAGKGDGIALEVFDAAGYYIGKAVSYVINILNIDTVVFGGGVSESFELLLPSARRALERFVFGAGNGKVSLVRTGLGYNAALIGSAGYALIRKRGQTR